MIQSTAIENAIPNLMKEFAVETFGIIGMTFGMSGFMFGMIAHTEVTRLRKRIESLESALEQLKDEQ